MTRWLILVWLALVTLPAAAAPVRVTSGEHEGFTRLVMEFDGPVDWVVGRTRDGYAMRVAGPASVYDLSRAFDVIRRDRLSAIWVDPESGDLRLGIGCACHAIPFEFRPGIVVIDLRDGPPPQGSSFEQAPDGAEMAALKAPDPPPAPVDAPIYDWTRPYLEDVAPTGPTDLPLGDLTLEPLREVLLRQLSRGAAQGVVDMAQPPPQRDGAAGGFDSAAFRMGEQANITITDRPDDTQLTAQGAVCIADHRLAVEAWADDSPVPDQMSAVMTGLTGEFDIPDPVAVARAVRLNLSLGFGAEARMLLAAFPSQQQDAALWTSMAHLLDGQADPAPAFAGMLGCDTNAALWAMLGDPAPVKGDVVAVPAVLRAFSAMPLHLRRHLGPRLADRFLMLGEAEAAYNIQQAILRVKGDAGPEVALMQARIDAHAGDLAAAEAKTGAVLNDSGPAGAAALVAMVELKAAQDAPVAGDTVTALAAYLKEGGPETPALQRALVLAQAASGDFATALATPGVTAQTTADVWRLLSRLAPDDVLLEQAVLAPGQAPPPAAEAVARVVAERLLALGLADQADRWARLDPAVDPEFLATIALQRRDGREALRLMAGRQDDPAQRIRAEALRLLGDEPAVAETFATLGEAEASWAAQRRAQDWPAVAAEGPEPWQAAAATLSPQPASAPAGPLAESQALLDTAAETRLAITDLLAAVPPP